MLATGSLTGVITFWDLTTRTQVGPAVRAPGASEVAQLRFSPDGQTLASMSQFSDEVIFWDVATHVQSRPALKAFPNRGNGTGYVWYGPDGNTLITTFFARSDDLIKDFASTAHVLIWNLAEQSSAVLSTIPFTMTSAPVAVSRDGRRLAILNSRNDDYSISVWDLATRTPLGESRIDTRLGVGIPNSMAFDRQGQRLAISDSSNRVLVWDTTHGQPLELLTLPSSARSVIAFGLDSQTLVTSVGNAIALLPLRSADSQRDSLLPVGEAFSPDSRQMATVDLDGTVSLWDVAADARIAGPARLPPDEGEAKPVAPADLSSDGAIFATAVEGQQAVYLWDMTTGLRFRAKLDITDTTLNPTEFIYSVDQLEFLSDGTLLINTAGRISRWDLTRRQRLGPPLAISGDSYAFFSVPNHGQEIAVVKQGSTEIEFWNVEMGTRSRSFSGGHATDITAVSFSAEGKVLASADDAGAIVLWDVDRRMRIGDPLRTGGSIVDLAFTPDSRRLISIGTELTVWDVGTRARLLNADLGLGYLNAQVSIAPDGRTLALNPDRILQHVSLDPSTWINRLCHIIGHDTTEAEWQSLGLADRHRPVCAATLNH